MSTYTLIEGDEQAYDAFISSSPYGSYYQSTTYAKTRRTQRFNRYVTVLIGRVDEGNEAPTPVGGTCMALKSIPHTPFSYGLMRLGFVLDYDSPTWREIASALWGAVVAALKREHVIYCKFGIYVPEDREDVYEFYRERSHYLDPNAGHESTFMRCRSELPITEDLPDVLAALPTKTRYMVNKAQKYGLELVPGTLNDLETFQTLKAETAARDGIAHLPFNDIKEIFSTVLNEGRGTFNLVRLNPAKTLPVLKGDLEHWQQDLERAMRKKKPNPNYLQDVKNSIAKLEAQIAELEALAGQKPEGVFLSAAICTHMGDKTMYYMAASSDSFRDYFPNYLMLWSFITEAKRRGSTLFDFAETYDDPATGLASFKLKWGAKTVAYSGDFELTLSHPFGDVFRMLMSRR